MLVRGKRVSSVAALSVDGIIAVEYTDVSMNADFFYNFVRGSLIPNLLPFDGENSRSIVIMDNCSIHHVGIVEEVFAEAGVLVIFLPPFSPDLNPIEHAFSKVKFYLKEHDEIVQVIDDIKPILESAFNHITTDNSRGWIQHCGYEL